MPNSFVIDACAGAGGKSLHLAALMKNQGTLISMDIHDFKLRELKRRAKRAGVTNIKTTVVSESTIIDFKEKADYLLLDVPCSGLGTLKRNPGAKWQLTPGFIDEIKNVQKEIITSYATMVKAGGSMVYATCSVLPSENEQVVKSFLASAAGKNFELIKQQTILPSDDQNDGFFMASIKKSKP
jgi:16S rRNA (cytosine967-C5)-methyltransferase